MAPGNLERIRAVFLKAREMSPDQRPAFLDKTCAGEPLVRGEVEQLLRADTPQTLAAGARDGADASAAAGPPQPGQPLQIGRYRIERVLGEGGFGLVYLARDEQLRRLVAIKVPHRRRLSVPADAAVYVAEARTAAGLDHPNIVPVYDVGSSDEFPCFIVSKYIEGVPLSQRIKRNRPSAGETAELVATIAEALHYAHCRKLVHRDIKPENILIDRKGTPFVVDFGVALTEENADKGLRYAGTPAYMSPEQARGEGHRVDGRSDIFSLGAVYYELLTASRPFQGDSRDELLEQVRFFEPRPPRQHDDAIPKELERICMKALSKRASERYSTARDLAEDLRHWISTQGGVKVRPGPADIQPASGPGKDIFLSHASADKETAQRLCGLIEARGVGCWIAPRDVTPGDDYAESIIHAIEATSVTVLLLSSHSNSSIHVKNEIERATSKGRRVVPVRLENITPDKSLELHLSRTQWVDAASLGLEEVAVRLVQVARGQNSKSTVLSRVTPTSGTAASQSSRLHIVPKGLRSFDAHDAEFFLELLPGPRDREGLPDSIRFWKARIEEPDADNTFAVGLIYGPSGCGKSSLVKAGLLPRLSDNVIATYLEATADDTETRLLNGLRKRCPALQAHLGLKETLASLRRGQGAAYGKKVLIVLDQFEQWLHARKDQPNAELVQALRQCDGGRVQCLVMVRDDFWMAATRFMRDLEIRLVEAQNSAAVDLFDMKHARRVLAAFGRAFSTLPEEPRETSNDSKQFLTQAVSGLAQDGKVISVRLALFAEMMKGKSWTPASLKEVGGTEGVGVTFLEETFSAATAPPEHRYHQRAARAVLKSLLPEPATDIRGHMLSHAELLAASGYANRPKDFDDLIRILDSEVRLLTPTDPEGHEAAEVMRDLPDLPSPGTPAIGSEAWSRRGEGRVRVFTTPIEERPSPQPSPLRDHASEPMAGVPGEGKDQGGRHGPKFYQLTHDYLVPALRDWLTRKQKETRRGRAELLLADRAGVWNARPENRQLPSLRQWLGIRCLTKSKAWTPPQRKMMEKATRHHALRGAALALLLAMATIAGLALRRQQKASEAAALVDRLIDADPAKVNDDVAGLAGYRQWADPLLRQKNRDAPANSRQKLHTSLALLPVDPAQIDFLYGSLLSAEPSEVPVITDALFPHRDALRDRLWSVVQPRDSSNGAGNGNTPPAGGSLTANPGGIDPQAGSDRLRAASALAQYDPDSNRWDPCARGVVDDLVRTNPAFFVQWREGFRPVKERLIPELGAVFRDPQGHAAEGTMAANLLADYAAGQPQVLADLLMDADETEFPVIFPTLNEQTDRGVSILAGEIDKQLPPGAKDEDTERLSKRQANAAVALLRMNRPEKVWPLLKHAADPRAQSYLIHRFGPFGAAARPIIDRLALEPDVTIQRALILSLGEFNETALPPDDRKPVIATLHDLYSTAPDPGLHAAAEWLLRSWKQDDWLRDTNRQWARSAEKGPRKLNNAGNALVVGAPAQSRQWYVNSQGQTMVVIPDPVEFMMGSPPTEQGREKDEPRHNKRISRTFALAAKPVTVEEYLQSDKSYYLPETSRGPTLPVVGIDWERAALYCNWLSKQEGIPENQWCFEIENGHVTKLRANYLRLDGYRLPTEAEMECATRAGTLTARYYGETDELLSKYAWYLNNSGDNVQPVGSRKPNDWGFFDLLGNVNCWCQEAYHGVDERELAAWASQPQDTEFFGLNIVSTDHRVLRGGSFKSLASYVRSARRGDDVPTNRAVDGGFRVARTLRPDNH